MPFSGISIRFDSIPSLLRHLPGGRFQAVLCHIKSSQVARLNAKPCPFGSLNLRSPRFHCPALLFASDRVAAAPLLICSFQLLAQPLLIASTRCTRFPSSPCPRFSSVLRSAQCPFASHLRLAFGCHALACPLISKRLPVSSSPLCSVHGHSFACQRRASPFDAIALLFISGPLRAVPFPVRALRLGRRHASPFHRSCVLVRALPYRVGSAPSGALPFRCFSAHFSALQICSLQHSAVAFLIRAVRLRATPSLL